MTKGVNYPHTLYQTSATLTAGGDSGPISAADVDRVGCFVNITAVSGTSPQLFVSLEQADAFGTWYQISVTAALTATGATVLSVGPGMPSNVLLTGALRLKWSLLGTTPSFTAQLSVIGC